MGVDLQLLDWKVYWNGGMDYRKDYGILNNKQHKNFSIAIPGYAVWIFTY